MTPTALKQRNAALVKQRNIFAALLGASILTTSLVALMAMAKSDKVVVIPSTLDEFTIRKGRVPDAYLVNMTRDMANLLFNRHPHDTAYFRINILQRVEPRHHDAIVAQIEQDEVENKYKQGDRNWRPADICVLRSSDGTLVTEAIGRLDTYVNDQRLQTEQLAQRFFWTLQGTRLYLADTRRIDLTDSECRSMEASL